MYKSRNVKQYYKQLDIEEIWRRLNSFIVTVIIWRFLLNSFDVITHSQELVLLT